MTQFALILILLALGAQTGNAIANVSIESLTTVDSAGGAFQNPSQTSFFAIGRQWVFYVENVPGHCDITDAPLCFVYYATNNGTGWSIYNSTKRIDPFCCGDNIAAPGLSVDTNGTYVFVVADGIGPNLAFHYGKLNLNGTISWKGDANVAEAASPTYLRLNTNNDVFVSYSNDSTFVSWSSAPYTTWSSFPLASTSSNAIAIAQLSKGHVYVAYHPLTPPVGLSFTIYGREWNGTLWGPQETVTTTTTSPTRLFLFRDSPHSIRIFYQGQCSNCPYTIQTATRMLTRTTSWSPPTIIFSDPFSSVFDYIGAITHDPELHMYFLLVYSSFQAATEIDLYSWSGKNLSEFVGPTLYAPSLVFQRTQVQLCCSIVGDLTTHQISMRSQSYSAYYALSPSSLRPPVIYGQTITLHSRQETSQS